MVLEGLQSFCCLILIFVPKRVLIYPLYFLVSSSSLPRALLNAFLFAPPSQRAIQLISGDVSNRTKISRGCPEGSWCAPDPNFRKPYLQQTTYNGCEKAMIIWWVHLLWLSVTPPPFWKILAMPPEYFAKLASVLCSNEALQYNAMQ